MNPFQRRPNSPVIRSVRPMVREDLETLRQPSARVRISKLRDQHHIMARLFVSGLSNEVIAGETGYSISRVAILRNSPAMQELVAKYRADDHDEWRKSRWLCCCHRRKWPPCLRWQRSDCRHPPPNNWRWLCSCVLPQRRTTCQTRPARRYCGQFADQPPLS